jgi:hypothetical protein
MRNLRATLGVVRWLVDELYQKKTIFPGRITAELSREMALCICLTRLIGKALQMFRARC